ncbi:MAG: MgtC/SapB family protein [Terracoccus sp.]
MPELLVASVLALLIGIEREARQTSAGIRTCTLVGLGSALFVHISQYGFTDVLGDHDFPDRSRAAVRDQAGDVSGPRHREPRAMSLRPVPTTRPETPP